MQRQQKRITIMEKLSAQCDDFHALTHLSENKMCTDCHPNDRILYTCLTQIKCCICFIYKKGNLVLVSELYRSGQNSRFRGYFDKLELYVFVF